MGCDSKPDLSSSEGTYDSTSLQQMRDPAEVPLRSLVDVRDLDPSPKTDLMAGKLVLLDAGVVIC